MMMKDTAEFKQSLKNENPGQGLSVPLKALWYDGKGDWQKAHDQVDHLDDRSSAHVHAYLHRKEGDIWNADYTGTVGHSKLARTCLWKKSGSSWSSCFCKT